MPPEDNPRDDEEMEEPPRCSECGAERFKEHSTLCSRFELDDEED